MSISSFNQYLKKLVLLLFPFYKMETNLTLEQSQAMGPGSLALSLYT